jgi:hypothetical protein
MALTPKNWQTFQHYKNRAPAWIKLHRGLLDDYAFSRLPLASRALAPLLWLLASEYEAGKITASHAEMAFRLRTAEKDFTAALKPLSDQGFFIDDSTPLARCKRDASPEEEREIQEQKEEEREIRAVAKATRPSDDLFDEFWKAYPKRDGANPKAPARKKFLAAVKSGVDPREIIASAKRSAEEARSKGQIGTPYVAQAMTWLGQQRWSDYEPLTADTATAGSDGFYAPAGSQELEAWDDFRQRSEGKSYPRDAKGGWHFPGQWPPEIGEAAA